jgi:hypothetical protein
VQADGGTAAIKNGAEYPQRLPISRPESEDRSRRPEQRLGLNGMVDDPQVRIDSPPTAASSSCKSL